MGRVHVGAYAWARSMGVDCHLAAVGDPRPAVGAGQAAENLRVGESEELGAEVRRYASAAEVFGDAEVELVSICTPTDTHASLAAAALEAGKHVLVEKPLATTIEEVRRVGAAARANGRLVMPAMCMRFWPGWTWLKDRVAEGAAGELGRLVGVTFTRMGAAPSWSPEFYLDPARSGGALFDLHIHDSDFVQYCLGAPEAVLSRGTVNHLTTMYMYRRGPLRVQAEGGWGPARGFPFRMRYTAQFERGTADWDLNRDPALMLAREGRWEPVPTPAETAYQAQARHMLEAVMAFRDGRGPALRATIEDAERVTKLLDAERRSLDSGRPETVA
jgi:predicted dehydrogenase